MIGRLALVGLLALLALAPGAGAASVGTGGARLTPAQVETIAAGHSRVAAITTQHPVARWTVAFDDARDRWKATLRDPFGVADLITVEVDDATARAVRAEVPEKPSRPATLEEEEARRIAGTSAKARDWVDRHRDAGLRVRDGISYRNGVWTMRWWADDRGEIAQVAVNDETGTIKHAWTGPQVAWSMARGNRWSFGRRINDPWIFVPLLAVFAVGLLDWRRLRSVRTIDVIALCGFALSLYFFNQGLVFWSVPTAYPSLLWLLGRLLLLGFGKGPRPRYATVWPTWLLVGVAVFALGFRVGLNAWSSNVIDVGYASVVGADRLLDGRSPYGTMPQSGGKPCGVQYADGNWSAYVQTDGACESAVGRGDTYGPAMYAAYVPATAALGWSGRWDDLPPAHVTAVVFDILAALGVAAAAWRLGGLRLGAAALFLWTTFPFTLYSVSSNANDPVVAACLAWAFALFTFPWARGAFLGLATAAKFAPILLLPLLARADRRPWRPAEEWPYGMEGPAPIPRRGRLRRLAHAVLPDRRGWCVVGGFTLAVVASFAVLVVLDGPGALRTFWDRTFGWQLDRPSPFSVWDWGDYPGFPDLAVPQKLLKAALVLFAAALLLLPRRLDAARVAALSGALLVGFQTLLTHWSYLYIPWLMPAIALALLAPYRDLRDPARPSGPPPGDPASEPAGAAAPADGPPVLAGAAP